MSRPTQDFRQHASSTIGFTLLGFGAYAVYWFINEWNRPNQIAHNLGGLVWFPDVITGGVLVISLFGLGCSMLLLAADVQELVGTKAAILPAGLALIPFLFVIVTASVICLSFLAIITSFAIAFWPITLLGLLLVIVFRRG